MNTVIKKTYGLYHFGMLSDIADHELQEMVEIFESKTISDNSPLGGRGTVSRACFKSTGPVVIKHYIRGGLIRHMLKDHYIRLGTTRCLKEFEQLITARSAGISVPEPAAYAFKGNMVYKGWLVTKEIEGHKTLAAISLENPELCGDLGGKVCDQIRKLVDNRIHHVDLHPGNIIIDADNNVFIIDFDKARASEETPANLFKRYADRWERAVRKHGLPEVLILSMRECFGGRM